MDKAGAAADSKNILVVEDEIMIRMLLEDMLGDLGYTVAGAVGAAICAHCFDKGWIRRGEGTRAVTVTPKGQQAFREIFGVSAARS